MPFAANGTISMEPLEGGIPITDAQYQAALEGIAEGLVVSVRDGTLHIEEPPEPEVPEEQDQEPQPITIFAPRDYLNRFTDAEYQAARYSTNFRVQRTLDSMIAAGWIDVNDADVAAGLDLMVAEGVIEASRKAELLAPEMPPASNA